MVKIETEKQTIRVTDGQPYMAFEINYKKGMIRVLNKKNEKEFVFVSSLSLKTLLRWEKVAKMMLKGIRYIKLNEYGKRK